MSWSLDFTGKNSIFRDSCHRMVVKVSIEDLDNEGTLKQLAKLSSLYFCHISIYSRNTISESNQSQFYVRMDALNKLNSLCQTDGKKSMFFTFHIVEPVLNTIAVVLSSEFTFDLWMIERDVTLPMEHFCAAVCNVHNEFQRRGSLIYLGVSHVDCIDDLDWLLQRLPAPSLVPEQKEIQQTSSVLQVVHLGDVQFPNLHLRTLELAHTRGLNVFLSLSAAELNTVRASPAAAFGTVALDKYNVSAETYLCKCLLQLGAVVELPLSEVCSPERPIVSAGSDAGVSAAADIEAHFSRLVHPFVHRKAVVSAVRVVSLLVEQSDVDLVAAASEEQEAAADVAWIELAKTAPQHRQLSYALSPPHTL